MWIDNIVENNNNSLLTDIKLVIDVARNKSVENRLVAISGDWTKKRSRYLKF